MALINVNNQAMPMGDNTGAQGDGQTGPKRHFKHIGELVDGGAKVVIMYRTVPGEPDNCLVVGTNMLAMMHNDNYIKKFKTNQIMVTFGNTTDGRILLNKLNEMVAKEKGVKVSELQTDPDAIATEPKAVKKATTKKADAKKTTAKE